MGEQTPYKRQIQVQFSARQPIGDTYMLAKLNTVNIGCRVEIYAPGSAFHEAHGTVTSWCNLDQNIASPCMAYVRIQRGIYRGGIYPIHQKNLKLIPPNDINRSVKKKQSTYKEKNLYWQKHNKEYQQKYYKDKYEDTE